MEYTLRRVEKSDAEELLKLFQKLDTESKFMIFEPQERQTTVEQQANYLEQIINSKNPIMLVAESERKIAGFCVATLGRFLRTRHCANLVIGVAAQFQRKGIGFELLKGIESLLVKEKITRLELTVLEKNLSAIQLYRKCGYNQEGLRLNSMRIDGHYENELFMSKLLT